jgi:hypothetical protein
MTGITEGGTETTGFGPDPAMEELFPELPPREEPQLYRPRQIALEARQVCSPAGQETAAWCGSSYDDVLHQITVQTHRGPVVARPGDWIVKGTLAFMVYSDDAFRHTYEPVTGAPASADLRRKLHGTWRTGRRVGHHIYAQAGPEPSDDDTPVVTVATPELAAALCEAHNALASPAGVTASGAERAAAATEAAPAPAEPPAGTAGPQAGSEGRSGDREPF